MYDTSKLLTYRQMIQEQPTEAGGRDAKFIEQEYTSREKLHRLLSSDPAITRIRYPSPINFTHARFDCYIVSGGSEFFLELKERPMRSDRWPDSLLDFDKVEALLDLQNTAGVAVLYSSLFDDDRLLLWRVDSPDRIETTTCLISTYRPELGKTKKTMHYFLHQKAISIQ